ncbi:helix-turn-helix domain-containing protein [Rossellomorea sp. LjRoot5]|uniref:helix-turn-helix domain-containing protein n=1 Tax=Rossellomorea sp. LjRoot5 TaxID=3342331 RepID=UPI003ECD7350
MNDLGNFLKELRGKLSLREVQEGTGISHTYLSTLEKGYDPRTKKPRKPTPEVLQKLARFYKVKYSDLMYLAGYLDESSSDQSDFTPEEKKEKTKEYILKIKAIDEELSKISKNKSSEIRLNQNSLDLNTLLQEEVNLFYKDMKLSNGDKEKIKTYLITLLE